MTKLEMAIITIGISNVAALNFKIVWEWLKGRKSTKDGSACVFHDRTLDRIREAEKQLMTIDEQTTRHTVLIEERTTAIFKKIDQNREDTRAIFIEISKLGKSVAGLIALVNDRRGEGFQR